MTSLSVGEGEVVGLLGRNGAGKSTTMRRIIGLTAPKEGHIIFKGEDVTKKRPFVLFRKGVGYVPDDRRVFADLSVDDNLEIVHTRDRQRGARCGSTRCFQHWSSSKRDGPVTCPVENSRC